MAATIQLRHSLTAGNRPGDLAPGEIAYNVADGFVYLGNGSNQFTDTLGNSLGTPSQNGFGWQQAIYNATPVNGSVTLAGIYDAQANELTSVTAAGTAAGFTVGPLPAADSDNDGYYVLVQIGGTLTAPAPVGEVADPGDWIVSTGTGWSLVAQSNVEIPAANVVVTPTGWITGPNMQQVLNEIVLNVITGDGGVVSALEVNPGNLSVYGDTTLGDGLTDATTVSGTLDVAGAATFAGAAQFNSPVSAQDDVSLAANLSVVGNITTNGNVTFGNAISDTATVSGNLTVNGNAAVQGTTTLTGTFTANGASTLNGAVTVRNNVEITAQASTWTNRAASSVFTSNVQLGDTSADSLVFRGSEQHFAVETHTGQVTFSSDVNLYGTTNYRRTPSEGTAPLNQFLVVPGSIIAFGGATAPSGYLACDGSAVSRAQYAALFAAIGTAWGVGDGSTTFNLPDLRGMFLRGTGTNGTTNTSNGTRAAGPAVGSRVTDTFRQHSHFLLDNNGNNLQSQWRNAFDTVGSGNPGVGFLGGLTSTGNVWSSLPYTQTVGSNETMPVNAGILYCIKS